MEICDNCNKSFKRIKGYCNDNTYEDFCSEKCEDEFEGKQGKLNDI